MIEANLSWDLLPDIDQQAYGEWAKKAVGTLLKAPGFVEFRAYRKIFGSRFFHPCTFFGIISSLSAVIEQLRSKGELNKEGIAELNLRIAQDMGFASKETILK